MNAPNEAKPSLNLGSMRRKAIRLDTQSLIKTGYLKPGQSLPLMIEPAVEGLDPTKWAGENLPFIEGELLKHGALLFRGMHIGSKAAFERFSQSIIGRFLNYVEGSSPRIKQADGVYTSTEYPPEYFISMHNELSYAHRWPGKIFFYCDIEPGKGGETPIADCQKVLQRLSPALRQRFTERGIKYTRNLHGGKGAGLSWQAVFETDDRAVVEAYCREGAIDFHWGEDGGLFTSQLRPAAIKHPRTGDVVWFNQADQWHPSNLGQEVSLALSEDSLPINAFYGDGTPIDSTDLDEVRKAFEETLVTFPWQKGDVLLVDNIKVAHGRMPFQGPRKILVTMGDSVGLGEVEGYPSF